MSEAAVFIYVGIIFSYNYYLYPICWPFVGVMFFIVIIGRFAAVYLSYALFMCCKGREENKLSFPQLTFISYAALIRGAIAFGLVNKLSEDPNFAKK